jgi:hypothetical protein
LDVPDGFNGSVVIESTEPVVAIVNELGDYPNYGASYEGFALGSQQVQLPNVQSANNGFYSFFNVQNAGSITAYVTVDFTPEAGSAFAEPPDETCAMEPGESCTFSQQPGQGFWNVGTWRGSATVMSDGEPIVASVNLVHEPGEWGMSSYSGFTSSGSTSAILPNIMSGNSNYWSGINVTNGGVTTTTVTLMFTPVVGPALPDKVYPVVAPGETVILLMPTLPDLAGDVQWIGSVEVDGGGENIFVIVNTLNQVDGEVAGWKGFDPAQATDTVVMPAILSDSSGYPFFTGFQVVNLGGDDTDITITYTPCAPPNCDPAWTPAPETGTILAGQSDFWIQAGGGSQWDGQKYIGAATITNHNGMPMLAIVNEIAPGVFSTGEATNSYNAFNR